MKHIDWMTCCLAFVGLLMVACSDKSDELGGGVLEPAEKSLVFPQKGGTRRVAVKTGGQEWNVKLSETAKDWCSAQALGDALEVTVGENNAPKSRNTRLALNSDGLTAEVEVKQMGSEPMIELGQKSITLDGDKNSFSIEVGANVPYDIIIEDDWIWHKETPDTRAELEVVTVEFGLTRNTTGEKRDTKIIFLSEDGKIAEELKVTQKVMVYEEENLDEVGDRKIKIASAEATDYHPTCPVESSFDDDPATYYHSDYKDNLLPVALTYHLTQPETIDYFLYMPRQDKRNDGSWGNVVISVEKNKSGTFEEVVQENFGQKETKSTRRYDFSKSLTEVTAVRFEIKDGFGDRASCAEMQFYQKNLGLKEEIARIFTSPLCEALKPGIGEKEVSAITNKFLYRIALEMLNGTYNTEYRIQTYEPYQNREKIAAELKIQGRSPFENATGICFEKGQEIVVFVDENAVIPEDKGLRLTIYDVDGNRLGTNKAGETDYPLFPGINKIQLAENGSGLGYISYFTESWETAPNIKIHIASGKVNGYYNPEKQKTAVDWNDLLSKTTYGCLDMIGKYAICVFPVEHLRQYCKDPKKLLDYYDRVVECEYDVMGLQKYNRVPKNHMYVRVVASGIRADGKGVCLPNSGMAGNTNSETCESTCWGVAHELGHNNQIAPDLNWHGCDETTNNIYAVCVRYELMPNSMTIEHQKNKDSEGLYVCSGRFNAYLTCALAKKEQWFYQNGGDNFTILCPFWQMLLYYRYMKADEPTPSGGKMRDWFGDVAEIARTNTNTSRTTGEFRCKFLKDACRVLGQNLTKFYIDTGMLVVCDRPASGYGGEKQLLTTQEMYDDVLNSIKDYPEPDTPLLYYLSADSRKVFEGKLPLQGGTPNTGVEMIDNGSIPRGVLVDENVWKNAVVFETYDKEELKLVSVIRTGVPGENSPRIGKTYVRYPLGSTAVYAVGYDGSRKFVYGTSNGVENK